jgi:hypothetical protein
MKDKIFLCFYEGDGGDSESHSTYYSEIISAENKNEALLKYDKISGFSSDGDLSIYNAIEKKINE